MRDRRTPVAFTKAMRFSVQPGSFAPEVPYVELHGLFERFRIIGKPFNCLAVYFSESSRIATSSACSAPKVLVLRFFVTFSNSRSPSLLSTRIEENVLIPDLDHWTSVVSW